MTDERGTRPASSASSGEPRAEPDDGPSHRAASGAASLVRRRPRWHDELRCLVAALGYFTRVPIPPAIALDRNDLAGAARYFPVVGALVGAAGALVYLIARCVFPPPVAVLLSMAATLLATGALHEDGLADCCDGFGGGPTREDALRIMRDPRLGAFGAIGLVIALALKWQTLAALPAATAAWTMVSAHAASRALAVSFLATHDYAREEGKAKPVAQRMPARSLAVALALGLPWLVLPDWRAGALGLAVALALRFLLGRYFARRLGGYTGDCLGLAQQIFELALYLSALAWTSF
ncbi:adenosylcobinamide-GDP ribazoletransferase [Trinickia dinghuensis]|uniref:Adenosylcobinamide-GDP ribazoletransferase n=1 Tax=Trinickia dinghuensis TaxID=2291023 RepID=A0A3D8JV42_9BURK|nr:adenosylcobinamide-GDP ribazoletransferase [Trinickia dinghuensis]RDU96595.1 adenosylcobinamide-GDP ribazoletransferase [Trinickia dinghuensis]